MNKKKAGTIEGSFVKVVSPTLARFKGSAGAVFYITMQSTDNVDLDRYRTIKVWDTGKTIGVYRVMKMIRYLDTDNIKNQMKARGRLLKAKSESESLMRESFNFACQGAKYNAASFLSYCDTQGNDASLGKRDTKKLKTSRQREVRALKALLTDNKIAEIKEEKDFGNISLRGIAMKKERENA